MSEASEPLSAADFMVPLAEDGSPSEGEVLIDESGDEDESGDGLDESLNIDDAGDDGEAEEETPAAEKIAPPVSWSKDDAKVFEQLTPEAQAVIARRESERDNYVREAGRQKAEIRQQTENEARQIIAQQADQYAAQLQAYAQQTLAQPPDQSLLYTNNPDDVLTYQRQDAAYRASLGQQQQLHQQITQAQQQALAARQQAEQVEVQADAKRLAEQLPEWFDTSTGLKLRQELQSIGAELGYSVELMAQASSVDILAIKKAAEWKAKADRFDKLNASKMETVRAAKGLPKMARPGATPSRGQQATSNNSRRSDAIQSFIETRSGADAAALLFERKR